MRVAVFTDTYLPEINGVTKTLGRLVDHLNSTGHEARVFCPTYREARKSDDIVQRAKSFSFPLYPECRVAFPGVRAWKKQIRKFNPDLIHLTTPFPVGRAGMKIARSLKIPFVASYHTNFDYYLSCYRLLWMRRIYWPYFRHFHNRCLMNFVPSTQTLSELERGGVRNVRIWARGIESDTFSPEKRSAQWRESLGVGDKKTLLYVGRLGPEKSVHILIDALRKLNERHADDIHLVLVGDGPSRAKLEASAPANTTFLGFKVGEELQTAFASADMFVFPSASETLGNVILEAQASRLPVVACNAGGIPDNVEHEQTGLLHAVDDADDLSAQIERLLEDEEFAARLARRGRDHAETMTWKSIFDRLLDDYKEACHYRENPPVGVSAHNEETNEPVTSA